MSPAGRFSGLHLVRFGIVLLTLAGLIPVLTPGHPAKARPAARVAKAPAQERAQEPAASPGQQNVPLPAVGEGSLLFRSPISGEWEPVPLLHTDVAIDVRGLVAAATVTQQYANTTGQPLEAIYVFPLPHDAAVYDMEIQIGERRIRSVVREREEAKRVYQAAKSEGKRAALVEEERPNIFTTSVANIMPGDRIDVHLRYVQPLAWEDGRIRLTFPMVVGPRYIPGTQAVGYVGSGWSLDTDAVPDASRITPPVRPPESRPGHDISVAVDLDGAIDAGLLRSPSHSVNVLRTAGGRQRVNLAGGATLPNRDFILELRQPSGFEPQTALFLSPQRESGETHFLLAAYPPTQQRGTRQPVEMRYLIDVSGSMAGDSILQARAGLLQALDRLSPADQFAIVAFDSSFYPLAAEPLPATTENLAAARRFVRGLQAGSGTEMLPALKHLIAMRGAEGFLRHIVVLTDGDLGNEEQIFAELRSNLGDARLFTVAIGSAPNHFLATKMAQFGRGTFTHVSGAAELTEQMGNLLDRIESPVLTDVKLAFEGVTPAEIYPERTPDLFLRQPLVVYGRIARGEKGLVRLTARGGDGRGYVTTIPIDVKQATFHPGITTVWARQKIEESMDRWRGAQEGERAEIRAAIIADAIRYNLVTRFTSLVAVEEVVVNPGGNSATAAVPTELPTGMQIEKVFGSPATGTAEDFLEALGAALLFAGATLAWLLRRNGAAA